MYKRLLNYVVYKKILHSKQFGFRMQYLTDFAIISIVYLIQNAIVQLIIRNTHVVSFLILVKHLILLIIVF